ncbi:MAG: hypothetical protein MUP60_01010, partial [Candidatus Thorarchaeota archaeon]|nr:hypothetical protein [Candidatus Thorarchaeota archaeon]
CAVQLRSKVTNSLGVANFCGSKSCTVSIGVGFNKLKEKRKRMARIQKRLIFSLEIKLLLMKRSL